MPVLYLTINSKVEIAPSNDTTKAYSSAIGAKQWVVADFKFGKKNLKIYHNEFVSGGQLVESSGKCHFEINGVVKMTIPPKSANQFLDAVTEWSLENVRVTDIDDNDPTLTLDFSPSTSGATIKVVASLDKP